MTELSPVIRETVEAYQRLGSQRKVAAELGIAKSTVGERLQKAGVSCSAEPPEVPSTAPLPDPSMPIEQVIAYRKTAFERRHEAVLAKRWRRFKVPTDGPYALMFVGDPHLDDDGCNWPLWEEHVALMEETPNLYAVNIGDTTNNWAGRLARLWANQDSSAETAKQIVRHYLGERDIPWFLWLHGNHDMWDGPVGRDVFERHKPSYVCMENWQAKVTLVSPSGREVRLWAAHNFKGNSIWNNLHGLERAAQMQDWAHLYVAGHHHDTGYRQGENPHRGFVYNLLRVRGYKFIDEYAALHGFGCHQYGASAIAVIDPHGDKMNAVSCFLDPFEGVEYLEWKRRKAAA